MPIVIHCIDSNLTSLEVRDFVLKFYTLKKHQSVDMILSIFIVFFGFILQFRLIF